MSSKSAMCISKIILICVWWMAQNSGVVVKGVHKDEEILFYGILDDVISLSYAKGRHVYLFQCTWWDVGHKTGFRKDEHFTSVNFSRTWYPDDPKTIVANRSKNDCPHTLGSSSCLRKLYEMRDPETGEFPGRVDFYKHMHQHPETGSWSSVTYEERHATMVRMLEEVSQQETEVEGESQTQTQFQIQFEVAGQVLGERIGYVKTYGHGFAPPSQQSTRKRSGHTEEEWNNLVQEASTVRSEVVEAQNEIRQLKENQLAMRGLVSLENTVRSDLSTSHR